MQDVAPEDTPPSQSGWRQLLAVCSLPGILAAPLALLHNLPWVPFAGPDESFSDQLMATRLLRSALPYQIALGVTLATVGAVIVGGGLRRAKFRAVIGTWLGALAAPVLLLALFAAGATWAGPRLGRLQGAANIAFAIFVLFELASCGVFYLVGVPILAYRRLRCPAAFRPAGFTAWLSAASVVGGCLFFVFVGDALNWTGVGFRGPGFAFFLFAICFAWGSGAGAYFAHHLRARRGSGEHPDTGTQQA